MRIPRRVGSALALGLLLVPAGFADTPRDAREKATAKPAGKTSPSDSLATPATKLPARPALSIRALAVSPRPASPPADTYLEDPTWTPLAATSGTIGLFTVETGDTLPRRGFSFSTYANKFSRMPASITVFNRSEERRVGKECRSRW